MCLVISLLYNILPLCLPLSHRALQWNRYPALRSDKQDNTCTDLLLYHNLNHSLCDGCGHLLLLVDWLLDLHWKIPVMYQDYSYFRRHCTENQQQKYSPAFSFMCFDCLQILISHQFFWILSFLTLSLPVCSAASLLVYRVHDEDRHCTLPSCPSATP